MDLSLEGQAPALPKTVALQVTQPPPASVSSPVKKWVNASLTPSGPLPGASRLWLLGDMQMSCLCK